MGTGDHRQILRHDEPVAEIIFSSGGKILTSVTKDFTMQCWDMVAGNGRRILKPNSIPMAFAVSPSGKIILGVAVDFEDAALWEMTADAYYQRLRTNGWVNTLTFSPDEKILALASSAGTVQVWDISTDANHGTPTHDDHRDAALTISPNGEILASSDGDTTELWDIATGTRQHRLVHDGRLFCVAFSPDAKTFASGSFNKLVKVWDVVSGTCYRTLFCTLSYGVKTLAFSPDGHRLAGASLGGPVQIWDVVTGACLGEMKWGAWSAALCFLPDGKIIALGSVNGTVQLWDTATNATGPQLQTGGSHFMSCGITALAVSRDGKILAFGLRDGSVGVWDMVGDAYQSRMMVTTGRRLTALSFSENNRYLETNSGLLDINPQAELPVASERGTRPNTFCASKEDG
ncbi:unnamed protein product [Parascedosporium putredinis]|uniref:WD40 repeat-like protein n=1 Tax=Parascedosporium putredinis TaxID=1442378 RepID=A0A9P1M964_9PEZI|nr:unnamed protein product [Parascedosporium putredinis]CAI7990221.1 unnamed protein product [Parascedosporium putredinis]